MWKQSYHFILVLQCFNQHPFMRRLNPNKKSRRATLNMSSWSTKEWTKTTNVLLFMPQSGNIPCKKWHTLQCYSLLQCWKFFKLRSSVRMFSKIYQMVKSTYLAAKWLGGGLIKQEVKLDNTYGILKDKMNKKVSELWEPCYLQWQLWRVCQQSYMKAWHSLLHLLVDPASQPT